jgi:hypothetical protein
MGEGVHSTNDFMLFLERSGGPDQKRRPGAAKTGGGGWRQCAQLFRLFRNSSPSFSPFRPRTKIPSKVGKDEGDNDAAGRPSWGKDMGGSRPKWTASIVGEFRV